MKAFGRRFLFWLLVVSSSFGAVGIVGAIISSFYTAHEGGGPRHLPRPLPKGGN